MKAIVTGFTTKSYMGYAGPGSHQIKDLTTVLPDILADINVKCMSIPDYTRKHLLEADVVFVKIWNVFDEIYAKHAPSLIDFLEDVDLNKIILISDHWNPLPAYNSFHKIGGVLKELAMFQHTENELINVYKPDAPNQIDPSVYCDVTSDEPFQSPRWIHGSLDYSRPPDNFAYPVDYYSSLTENELCGKIKKHGLVYANEYPGTTPLWWRIRYYMAAINRAAVYASERDQRAIYGFYIEPKDIERYRKEVARLQSSVLLDNIEPESSIQRKVLNLIKMRQK